MDGRGNLGKLCAKGHAQMQENVFAGGNKTESLREPEVCVEVCSDGRVMGVEMSRIRVGDGREGWLSSERLDRRWGWTTVRGGSCSPLLTMMRGGGGKEEGTKGVERVS